MNNGDTIDDPALPLFVAALKNILPDVELRPCETFNTLGARGAPKFLPSSAVRLDLGTMSCLAPWPALDWLRDDGIGTVFRRWGRLYFFPTIRLRVLSEGDDLRWEFYTVDAWLKSALTRWRFPLGRGPGNGARANDPEWATFESKLRENLDQKLEVAQACQIVLNAVGTLIKYALWGRAGHERHLGIYKATGRGLSLPTRDAWLRPLTVELDAQDSASGGEWQSENSIDIGDASKQSLAVRSLRSLVITAEEFRAPRPKYRDVSTGIPRIAASREHELGWRAEGETPQYSQGIDPFHTPEGDGIRRRLRLGLGVRVNPETHQLELPHSTRSGPRLSPSSSRLPFAGYNDPRRILLAAKAQEQSVPLVRPQTPLVLAVAEPPTPPGVNLRVAYMAWAGWNHEDAWVLSESAAKSLRCYQDFVQTVHVNPCEVETENLAILERLGQTLEAGSCLIERQIAPAFLLWPEINQKERLYRQGAQVWRENRATLRPEKGERALRAAELVRVEIWDFAGNTFWDSDVSRVAPETLSENFDVPEWIRGRRRKVIRFYLRGTIPLSVGDKLANRHGHKGVVGQILPDNAMPIWDGRPLDALVDPISVLNRSNWGQLYECMAGAVAEKNGAPLPVHVGPGAADWLGRFRESYPEADAQGRSIINPPANAGWLHKGARAVAGVQFVMRMPQHAADKARTGRRRTGQRFGIWEHLSLWAHGVEPTAAASRSLTRGAKKLQQLLRLAAVELVFDESHSAALPDAHDTTGAVYLRRFDLAAEPPSGGRKFEARPTSGRGGEAMIRQLERLDNHYLLFDPPLSVEREPDLTIPWKLVRWFPISRPQDVSHSERILERENHRERFVKKLVELCNKARTRAEMISENADGSSEAGRDKKVLRAIHELIYEAKRRAVGTGKRNEKFILDDDVLGVRRPLSSARAVITPSGLSREQTDRLGDQVDMNSSYAGGKPLGLDEVELPELFRKHLGADELGDAWIWLKRDPVLHRWGLLPVKCRFSDQTRTIRLPASLLGPLAADYDGDDAAVFRIPAEHRDQAEKLCPSQISLHNFGHMPLFAPGKQYVYGLHLLQKNAQLVKQFNEQLDLDNAPQWPDDRPVKDALTDWLTKVGRQERRCGNWWAILEKYALLALADDPGMGLGIFKNQNEITKLDVVTCGAARNPVPDQDGIALTERTQQETMIRAILEGRSLTLHERDGIDLIRDIMCKAASLKAQFGNEVRHYVFRCGPERLNKDVLVAVQTLCEKLSQSVLSVKGAGEALPNFREYKRIMRNRWLPSSKKPKKPESVENTDTAIDKILRGLEDTGVVGALDAALGLDAESDHDNQGPEPEESAESRGRRWLEHPGDLFCLLHPSEQNSQPSQEILLPADDLRVSPFFTEMGSTYAARPE